MKILGLNINTRYRWDHHINYLVSSLSSRLKIIKCFSNPKMNCNTYTIISIIKSILLSKINYALVIYGHSSNSKLRKLKSIINSAVRSSLGAFRSTPVNNMLFESNILSLVTQTTVLTTKLLKSLAFSANTPILKLVSQCRTSKKNSKNTVIHISHY